MCPSIALLGDISTDHDGSPPTPVIAASPNVFLDGKPVARKAGPLAPHDKSNNPHHPRSIAGGVVIGSGCGQAG
ncbi:type VI secretion system PAAR protein [Aeromonas enteropelogenes]|uniref:type VI secretion system PAAR protein n=1 Tax=Aeromonas enteropelogenes TaxID=29489 RepID=UPI003CC708E7